MNWQLDRGGRHWQILCLLRDKHPECRKTSCNSVFKKTNHPNRKRKKSEQIFLRRRNENDQQADECMPCLINMRRNANQKSQLTLHACSPATWKWQTLAGVREDAETLEPQYMSEWEYKRTQPLWEDSLTSPQNAKHDIAKWPNNSQGSTCPREVKTFLHWNSCLDVHGNAVYTCQKRETAHMSIIWGSIKQNVAQ